MMNKFSVTYKTNGEIILNVVFGNVATDFKFKRGSKLLHEKLDKLRHFVSFTLFIFLI